MCVVDFNDRFPQSLAGPGDGTVCNHFPAAIRCFPQDRCGRSLFFPSSPPGMRLPPTPPVQTCSSPKDVFFPRPVKFISSNTMTVLPRRPYTCSLCLCTVVRVSTQQHPAHGSRARNTQRLLIMSTCEAQDDDFLFDDWAYTSLK